MKTYIILFSIIMSLFSCGCKKLKIGNDFLEKAPGVDITQDTVFSDIKYAERFLWGAYGCLPYGIVTNTGSARTNLLNWDVVESLTDINQDCYSQGAVTTYYNGSLTPGSGTANSTYDIVGDGGYDGIRRCWIFLANIDRVPNATDAYKTQLKNEARMLIAFQYAHMYRYFGGLPWFTHAYDVTESVGSVARLTAQAICDSVVLYCDKYGSQLPWIVSDPATMDGRVTRYWAMALKARILLFNASPLFNADAPYLDGDAAQQKLTWHGGYNKELWKKAMDAAHDFIAQVENTGDFKMYHKAGNSFRKDYQEAYFLRNNQETIISIRNALYYNQLTTYSTNDYAWSNCDNLWGILGATDDYVKMFPMASGKKITDPTSGYDSTKPYINRDPRLYETVLTNGDAYRSRVAEMFQGGQEAATGSAVGITGYRCRKFLLDEDNATLWNTPVSFPNLRLPEIYLSYAEADNEYNAGPDAEAYRCVNIVRNRVGLANLPAGLTQVQFREAVLTERACEFGYEEVRWYDLVRWKRENDFKKHLHGMKITKTGGTSPNFICTYSQYEFSLRYWMQVWSPKWYLNCFPQNEINKGYGLVQNPGW